ncbi:MAG: dihydrolipoamide acetyltransferase family protein [Gammaproteobacteria bacterium]
MSVRIVAVVVPKWGLEMTEGTVSSWLKQPGDAVTRGEPLIEIESEKIVNSLDAPADGVLRRILLDAGNVAAVGSLIGVIADASASDDDIDRFIRDFRPPDTGDAPAAAGPPTASAAPAPSVGAPPAATTHAAPDAASDTGAVRVSPPVRRLAESLGVSLTGLRGSGPNGRILQEDVERAARGGAQDGAAGGSAPATASAAAETPRLEPWSATRRAIAKRMQDAARDIPHFYLVTDVDASALLAQRERLRSGTEPPSVNDLIVHAVARVLPRHPRVNAHHSDEGSRVFSHAHIAVAMATPDGVLAPVVPYTDRLPLAALSTALRDLRGRVAQRKLGKTDLEGGSFTVSNLGMYGVREFTSIITPPQSASLAVGAVRKEGAAATLTLTLSCDHRALDGATGAAFLRDLKEELEKP